MTKFWVGTKIIKSTNNDFNWRDKPSDMAEHYRHLRQSQAGKINAKIRSAVGIAKGEPYYISPSEKAYQKIFTTFSKAVPTKFNGKSDKL
jgi:hypothetical protein